MKRSLLLSALLTCLACREPPALEVGGVAYREGDLLGLTPERRGALADLTAFGAAVADGTVAELGRPLVAQGVRRRLGELLRAQQAFDSMGIEEAALRAHYDGAPELELTVRHLIVLSARYEAGATREAARAKAARALERIQAGEEFPTVAAEVSEEPGAEGRQGLLRPGREGSWVDEFWNAALALRVGEVSPVVETQYGFHVLRMEDRVEIPFEEARGALTLKVAEMVGVRPSEVAPVPAPERLATISEEALAARLEDPAATDSTTVASWSARALRLGELRDRVATLGLSSYHALLDPARAPALGEEVEAAARWIEAAEQARARGFQDDAALESAIELEWTNQAQLWASALGFRPGMERDAVKAAALAALGATAQNASLARTELLERTPLLRRAYLFPPPPAPGDG